VLKKQWGRAKGLFNITVSYKQNLPYLYFPVWIERFFIRPITASEDKKSLNPDGVLKQFSLITGYYVIQLLALCSKGFKFFSKTFAGVASVTLVFLKSRLFKRADRRVDKTIYIYGVK
jgi:hypothetical protein